ncbi:MAG TPA: hypothetical protein IAB46_01600 [Candidatus Scybalocola faecigallinarum]|uniref:beta-N-acetylhexosaminidase n=1 Tax=Candidatus Scybalocola faecigallinarum TaxID=2840941 RepID=A0A9D1F2C3_9FIRM|nr:hypothetical protein [Candidatus Scybalocola faecigallinarum]
MNMDWMQEKPFYLKEDGIAWVKHIFSCMTDEQKIGQLFVLECVSNDLSYIKPYLEKAEPGGVTLRADQTDSIKLFTQKLQECVKIPLLISANICHGIGDIASDERNYLSNMGVGACQDAVYAYRQGVICGEGGNFLGISQTFAPVADLNINFMNSVIGTRSYGSNPKLVADMVSAYIHGVQEKHVAATFKHFPGDGVDFRDQHVTPSVNSLTCEEWDASFGYVYKKAIDAGAMCCMVDHITMPSYSMRLNPRLTYGECLPATLSKELVTDLLRGKLGFNGLIMTDATHMAGMAGCLPRAEAVPLAIEAGCDMFLFYRDFDEDFRFMKEGLERGRLSRQRLDEAVLRILALKAALGLPWEKKQLPKEPSGLFDLWTREAMNKSITLVKNLRPGLFPITPERYPKILLYSHVSGHVQSPAGRPGGKKKDAADKEQLFRYFCGRLEALGFLVEVCRKDFPLFNALSAYHSREAVKAYDLVIHFANGQNENGRSERLFYEGHCSDDGPYTDMYVPTLLISMNSPYLLADAPRVKTAINCYTNTEEAVDALLDKLTGKSGFMGISPVDPFCGLEDTRW